MQLRMVTTLERLRDAHPGGTIVCVSHADPIKAAVAHALGTHLDLFQRIVISTCSISSDRLVAVRPRRAGRQLDRPPPDRAGAVMSVMGVFFEFDEVDTFTAAAIGEPGSRVFYLHARSGAQRVSVKCEKQQVSGHLAVPAPGAQRPAAARGPPDARRGRRRPTPASSPSCSARSASATTAATTACSCSSRSSIVRRRRRGRRGRRGAADRGHIRLYVTRGQAAAFCDHADEIVAAGRPSCMWCGNPIDPDGHPCPRMN